MNFVKHSRVTLRAIFDVCFIAWVRFTYLFPGFISSPALKMLFVASRVFSYNISARHASRLRFIVRFKIGFRTRCHVIKK